MFLRDTSNISLLEEHDENSMTIFNSSLGKLTNNKIYFKRCLSKKESGRIYCEKKLQDARKVFFNQEDIIIWLNKIKEDAIVEIDIIFIKYEASIGMNENDINFEKAGFLTGIYEKADEYLGIIKAIQPLDKNKPHYTILDYLEKLDTDFIENDEIPGYYRVQKNTQIKKHLYEIKNLNDYWQEYLSLNEKHETSEGFGDIKYLLSNYHGEFMWEMIKYRPRKKIKSFLDYQLKGFKKDPIYFLNNIEYRILPQLDGYASNDYPVFEQLIKEWLKDKRNHITIEDEKYLLNSVRSAIDTFVDDIYENRKRNDENKYNTQIRNYLKSDLKQKKWYIKDQSLGGETDTKSVKSRAGVAFRDLIIFDENNFHITAFECFRIKNIPNKKSTNEIITNHLNKIFRNEPLGISPLFVIIYYENKTNFNKNWNKYLDYVEKMTFKKYSLINLEKKLNLENDRANIKIAKATHLREANEITIYHLIINMYP